MTEKKLVLNAIINCIRENGDDSLYDGKVYCAVAGVLIAYERNIDFIFVYDLVKRIRRYILERSFEDLCDRVSIFLKEG